MTTKLRIGSLFTGTGALDRAVQNVLALNPAISTEVAWFCDNMAASKQLLEFHYPHIPNVGDVTQVDWNLLTHDPTYPNYGPIDVLTAGFPCQDVSHAGKRAGLGEDTRSGLWARACEAIDALRPRLVVLENVSGLRSTQAGTSTMEYCSECVGEAPKHRPLRALGRVLGDLAEIGYDAAWTSVRASDIGAPHRRERVFIIAWPSTSDPHVSLGSFGTGLQQGDSSGVGWRRSNDSTGETERLALFPTPAVSDMGAGYTVEQWDEWTARMKAKHGNGNGHGNSLNIEAMRYPGPDFGKYAAAIERWESLLRPVPPPTAPSSAKSDFYNLNPVFVEWLMGYDEGFVTDPAIGLSRRAQIKMLGNGVVQQQAECAILDLLITMEETV